MIPHGLQITLLEHNNGSISVLSHCKVPTVNFIKMQMRKMED